MDTNSWTARLTIDADNDHIRNMRDWLDEYAPPVPSRNSDVLSKFINATLNSNAQWDNIGADFSVDRALPNPPWLHEKDWDEWDDLPEGRGYLSLAVDGCATLMVLACITLVGLHLFHHSPNTPATWYNTAHANNSSTTPGTHSQ